jgi:2-keto-3-deoxy-L-rhamnonate aldolase RhmA
MSVIARVPDKSPYWINLFLDRGIQGIVGPHVETKKEAQDFADACLFPPDGNRSWGGGRGTEFNDDIKIDEYGGKLEFAKWTNKNMLVIAQIESVPGWDNLNEILDVKGLSGITGGPNDLAASMGIPGEPNNPKREKLTIDIDNTARSKNKLVQLDIMRNLSIQNLMIENGRKFVNEGN